MPLSASGAPHGGFCAIVTHRLALETVKRCHACSLGKLSQKMPLCAGEGRARDDPRPALRTRVHEHPTDLRAWARVGRLLLSTFAQQSQCRVETSNVVIVVEIKSVTRYDPVFLAQMLTYLRITRLRVGLIMNFNRPRLIDGIKRVVL